jgi:predicted transposase YdaD
VDAIDLNHDDYDSPWKEAVEHYFPEFMAFYFADACAEIDWQQGYVFLDQELQAVVQDAELGKRYVDKLVRVNLLNGDESWIYVHIEVQGNKQTVFAERMFVYNYRLYDRYRRPIASLAVLADEHPNWRPQQFTYSVLGCETSIRFPIAKLIDYHDQLDTLLEMDNAFALITAAHILTQQTRKNQQQRYQAKLSLIRLLYQRQWEKQRIIDLFFVLDWLMRLPDGLEKQIWQAIETIEEDKKMRYVSSVERFGIEKGVLQGRIEGRQEGRQEGRLQGRQEGELRILKKLLERRFGTLTTTLQERLNNATEADLDRWTEAVLSAPTVDDVFNA